MRLCEDAGLVLVLARIQRLLGRASHLLRRLVILKVDVVLVLLSARFVRAEQVRVKDLNAFGLHEHVDEFRIVEVLCNAWQRRRVLIRRHLRRLEYFLVPKLLIAWRLQRGLHFRAIYL